MTFGNRFWHSLAAVALGGLISCSALAQSGSVVTRLVVKDGSATSVTILPGGTTSMDVRLDVSVATLIGTGFTLTQLSPALSGFISITGRSSVGSLFDSTASGTPDGTLLVSPSNLLDPTNNNDAGRTVLDISIGVAPASNMLATNLTFTASASTPLGTYTIGPTAGGSSNATEVFDGGGFPDYKDYDMSGQTPFTIIVGQTLTVTKSGAGAGAGTVTANAGAISCGATCSDIYPGTLVTLTATPGGGGSFVGWSGAGCGGAGTCAVTVDAAKTVNAEFAGPPIPTFDLTVTTSGTGTGTVANAPVGTSCGANCARYVENIVVTLTPTPAAGSAFANWTGACTGSGACVVTMSANRSVGAVFNLIPFSLTVSKNGNGTGTVTSDVGGINCGTGAACTATYPNGTVVTLTATPDAGKNFTAWTGGGCSGAGTCVVTIAAATAVTATFTDTIPPETTINSGPTDPSSDANPTFTFSSNEAGSTFRCSLDGAPLTACTSPRNVSVGNGAHTFSVVATDAAGNADPTPAVFSWTAAGIVAPPQAVEPIPTLSEWMLVLLALMVGTLGVAAFRRRS